MKPCNEQEGSARRVRTRNRPANARRSRARNERRRSRRGRLTDKREVCVGPHREHVGKSPAKLCMQRGVRISRQGRTQPGAKCTVGPYTEREAKPMAGPFKGQQGGAWWGSARNTSASAWRNCAWNETIGLRGWAVHRPGAKCTAGPYTGLDATPTARPCTEGAGTCVAGPCTGREAV